MVISPHVAMVIIINVYKYKPSQNIRFNGNCKLSTHCEKVQASTKLFLVTYYIKHNCKLSLVATDLLSTKLTESIEKL